MEKENDCQTISFQLKLLLGMDEMRKYPFTRLVIEKNLTKEEYEETMILLQTLSEALQKDLSDGLVDHSGLLFHFAGMLCYKLPIEETINALQQEGLFTDLASKLKKLSET